MSGRPADEVEFVDFDVQGRRVRVEYAWIAPERLGAPLVVFLHEGLGSLAMWKAFPRRLCDAAQVRGLVWSRPGYGRSTPREPDETWAPDFMHRQAHGVLPALLKSLGIDPAVDPPWLFGHSDGGSIALLHAARFPGSVAGAVVLAPHIVVEDVSIASIEDARHAYLTTSLRSRLAKYHDDPDSAFWGWNRIWLDPAFRSWSIETAIESIRCPVLALQGQDDLYGTLAQIHGIGRRVAEAELLALPDCGHSPHIDQPDAVIAAVCRFIGADRQTVVGADAADTPGTAATGPHRA